MEQHIAAIRKHALANYNRDGWDILVECWSDSDILDILRVEHCTTEAQAIKALRTTLRTINGVRAEHEAEAEAGRG
jgi:hypothetical protein